MRLLTRFVAPAITAMMTVLSLAGSAMAQNNAAPNSTASFTPSFTPAESLTIAFLKARGVNHFLMLNKARGTVRGISEGASVFEVKALFGKTKGDSKDITPFTTPAGIHELTPTIKQDHPQSALVFERGPLVGRYVIHRLIDPPGENRPARLASATPHDNYISHGCVNVAPHDYKLLSNFAQGAQQHWIRPTGQAITTSFFVVMPEKDESVRQIFKIPEDFALK